MKNFTQVNRASSGAKKNFTQLESNLSCMAWNLHVIERRFSSADKLSGSRSERSLTSEKASIQHPFSIHSASIGIRRQPRGWKYVAMIFAVLVMSVANVGTAWG